MKEISDFISNVGFPIVISLLMLHQNLSFNKMYQETIQGFSEKLESNTNVLNRVWEQLEKQVENKVIK